MGDRIRRVPRPRWDRTSCSRRGAGVVERGSLEINVAATLNAIFAPGVLGTSR
jgi:hypothetical protein